MEDRPQDPASFGVLLLAHGGPSRPEEIPSFLGLMRGRAPSAKQVQKVTERYCLIGGSSPAAEFAASVARKLQTTCGLPVYTGMLYWHPLIEEAMLQIAADRVSEVLVICLVPHYSGVSVGRYQRRAIAAGRSAGVTVDLIDNWHMESSYVAAVADAIASALATLAPKGSLTAEPKLLRAHPPHVVFTAHSLPIAAMRQGDPYEPQLLETAEAVAGQLRLRRNNWSLAFQSAAGPPSEWLGPSAQERLIELAAQGIKQVVICPFGFLFDQVEILVDLDMLLKAQAKELGIELARTAMFNDSAPLEETLATLVRRWRNASGETSGA